MKRTTLTCDICKEAIGVLPNEDEVYYFNDELIVHSNYPSYVKIRIDGHGLLAKEERNLHLCKHCYDNIKHMILHTNKEETK